MNLECYSCESLNVDTNYLTTLLGKYSPKNFNELMENIREEKHNELIKCIDFILKDKSAI